MLQTENFIYFFTVCGFFIGIIFSILNFSSPGDILLYTSGITLFFYLFVHIVAINFVDFSRFGRMIFDKKEHEEISDYFIKELDARENRLDSMLLDLEKMNRNYKKHIYSNSIGENGDGYKKAA
ncbi:MAG: hypothetical protein QM482_01430 [Sulfurospirillum sp.]